MAAEISKNTVHSSKKLKKPHGHPPLKQYVMPPPCYAFQTIPKWVQSQNHTQTPALIRAWTSAHSLSVSVNVLHPLPDGNLIWGLSILRTVIPRCHSRCSFSCFRAGASIPRNTHSLRCCDVTMKQFHSSALPFFHLKSFLLFSSHAWQVLKPCRRLKVEPYTNGLLFANGRRAEVVGITSRNSTQLYVFPGI